MRKHTRKVLGGRLWVKGLHHKHRACPTGGCGPVSRLWVVERAFRISKGTLEMRPIFHFTERRIEAHICICFIAYKVYKEFERQLLLKGIELSADKVLDIAKTVSTVTIDVGSNSTMSKTLLLTDEQRLLAPLLHLT